MDTTKKLSILIIDDEPSDIENVIIPSFIENTLLSGISERHIYNSIDEAKKKLSEKTIENIDFLFLDQIFETEFGDKHDEDEAIKILMPIVNTNYPFCRTIILSKNGSRSKKPHKFFCDDKYYLPYPRKEYNFKFANEVIQKEFSDWNKSLLFQLKHDEYEKIRKIILDGEKQYVQVGGRSFSINTFFKHLECENSNLSDTIVKYLSEICIPSLSKKYLLTVYEDIKTGKNTEKGKTFEDFVESLFRKIGYHRIQQRVRDISKNEIDIAISNEIDDTYLSKILGDVFFVECKNKPNQNIGLQDFNHFFSKINRHDLARYGFFFTTSERITNPTKSAVIIEAITHNKKIIFFTNTEIKRLIESTDIKEEFKSIIGEQIVKNN